MCQAVLGIDVSKETLDAALIRENEAIQYHHVNNSRSGFAKLLRWLRALGVGEMHACLEATGMYGDRVAEFLHNGGHQVSVVNPRRIKAYGDSMMRRFKNDKGDAEVIARFCQVHRPALWAPPEPYIQELRELVRHREDLIKAKQQQSNRIQSGVRSHLVLQDLQEHIAFIKAQIDNLNQEIVKHISRHPELKRQYELLKSITGIGPVTAAALLGEVRSFQDFESARQLAAWAGLVPEERTSGSSVRKRPRMVKKGNAHLRNALYMPAIVAKNRNPLMMALSDRMTETGHCNMQIIGAVMRKLLHIAFGVIKTDKPFDPKSRQGGIYSLTSKTVSTNSLSERDDRAATTGDNNAEPGFGAEQRPQL